MLSILVTGVALAGWPPSEVELPVRPGDGAYVVEGTVAGRRGALAGNAKLEQDARSLPGGARILCTVDRQIFTVQLEAPEGTTALLADGATEVTCRLRRRDITVRLQADPSVDADFVIRQGLDHRKYLWRPESSSEVFELQPQLASSTDPGHSCLVELGVEGIVIRHRVTPDRVMHFVRARWDHPDEQRLVGRCELEEARRGTITVDYAWDVGGHWPT